MLRLAARAVARQAATQNVAPRPATLPPHHPHHHHRHHLLLLQLQLLPSPKHSAPFSSLAARPRRPAAPSRPHSTCHSAPAAPPPLLSRDRPDDTSAHPAPARQTHQQASRPASPAPHPHPPSHPHPPTPSPTPAPRAKPVAADPARLPSDADLPALARALVAMGPRRPRVTFLLGGPGAGKGTLSEYITAHDGSSHASVGALLRAASASGTAEGRHISAVMSRGGIVSSATATGLLLRHLLGVGAPSTASAGAPDSDDSAPSVVVDGYPRTFANAVMFDSLGLAPARVIAMEVDERVMWQRLGRRGRRDDVPDIVRNRLVEFRAEWESIKEFYRRRGLLVELDASGAPAEVWQRYLAMEAATAVHAT